MPTHLEKFFHDLVMPHSIIGVADSTDTKECVEYWMAATQRFLAFLETDVRRYNRDCPYHIDFAPMHAAVIDAFGDFLGGPAMTIAEQLDEDETESRETPGRYSMAGE